MKKRIAACLLALLLLCMTGCEKISEMMNTGDASAWINSDMKESYENVGEIRLQDDFAAAVNRDWVTSQESDNADFFQNIQNTVNQREKEILNDPALQDHDALELKKFAELAMDMDYRNSQGIEPLRRYIESIQSISSKEDVYRWICDSESNPLFLAPLILRSYDKDYENEDEETISKACSELISYMSRCCQYNFLSNMCAKNGINLIAMPINPYIFTTQGSSKYGQPVAWDLFDTIPYTQMETKDTIQFYIQERIC